MVRFYSVLTPLSLTALPAESLKTSPECVDSIVTITHGGSIREDDLILIGELVLEDGAQFSTVIRTHLLSLIGDPMLSMLDLRSEDLDQEGVDTVTKLVGSVNFKNNPKVGVVNHTHLEYFYFYFFVGDSQGFVQALQLQSEGVFLQAQCPRW